MLSRALAMATVMLLIECLAIAPGRAQTQNLEAGKSPSQIFTGTCSACHKSPRGLLKTVGSGSLAGFLRQHYTTSSNMASVLSAFLISNGAADIPRSGREARQEAKPSVSPDQLDRFGHRLRPAAQEEAAQPNAISPNGLKPNTKRLARPADGQEPANAAAEGQSAPRTASEGGPNGPRSPKQRLSKRGKPSNEEPAAAEVGNAGKGEVGHGETAKSETGNEETKNAAARDDRAKSEGEKDVGDAKPEGSTETAKVDAAKPTGGSETPVTRADPVPPLTPEPGSPAAVSQLVPATTSEPAAAAATASVAPAVTASMPPLPPVPPAGPPAPPISQ